MRSGIRSGRERIASAEMWSQVQRLDGGWVWQVWWGDVLVRRGVCRWHWQAALRGWRVHREWMWFLSQKM